MRFKYPEDRGWLIRFLEITPDIWSKVPSYYYLGHNDYQEDDRRIIARLLRLKVLRLTNQRGVYKVIMDKEDIDKLIQKASHNKDYTKDLKRGDKR